jgi:AcrR family transcriptional regulator
MTNVIVANMFVTNKFGANMSVNRRRWPRLEPVTKAPQSRRERPAKPALSRAAIVAAALRIMETEAPDKLTMRRLAAELDTGPASLYVYVRNTAELYAHVLDAKLATLDLSWDAAKTPWMERLTALLMSYVELLMRYPSLSRSALLSRPTGESYMALVELLLKLLTAGGAPAERAAWGVDILLQTATASAVEISVRASSDDAPGEWEALTAAIENASPERFPLIAGLGVELLSGSGPDRGTWAFEVLANGILATPRPGEQR